jgi:predicted 3-demethylubiquinone-9 3-methyltransferase (glyoxalase superfamily)
MSVTPFLWFDDQAEEAANLYVSIFTEAGRSDSRVGDITRYGPAATKAANRPEGSVMTVEFRLDGQDFVALNGGPEFRFTEAVSFQVSCETQDEVDLFWKLLSDGGEEGPCGWLKDRYGLSWQITPTVLFEWQKDEDPEKAERVTAAMLQMGKIDIEGLRRAYDG